MTTHTQANGKPTTRRKPKPQKTASDAENNTNRERYLRWCLAARNILSRLADDAAAMHKAACDEDHDLFSILTANKDVLSALSEMQNSCAEAADRATELIPIDTPDIEIPDPFTEDDEDASDK